MKTLLTLVAVSVILASSLDVRAGNVLVLGRPASQIQKEYQRLLPIAAYLGTRLGRFGFTGGDVMVAGMNTVEEAIGMVRDGKLDLVFETPYSAMKIVSETGAVPLMTMVRDGLSQYGGCIFVRKDSGIDSLEGLRGKVVAFEDAGSTSGYHLPMAAMRAHGLNMVPLASPDHPLPAGATGYVFAQSELNISSWVFFRKVAAGAYSEANWNSQDDNPAAFREKMRILHETAKVPRMIVLARQGLSPALESEIVRLLLSMPDDPAGREALQGYGISGFKPVEDRARFLRDLKRSLGM